MQVYSNVAHPKATLVAWFNQGITGAVDQGQNPDKAQYQLATNAVEHGTPLVRAWNGQTYQWPAGSPILMDLEPLWFDPDRSESQRLHWHVRVAGWIKNAYPQVRLISYSGLNLNLRNCGPFVKTQTAICPGDYFGTDLDARTQFWLDWERDKILDYRQAYPNKDVIWFTQASYAPVWSPRIVDESTGLNETDDAYNARMYTLEKHYDAIYDNLAPYINGVFAWEGNTVNNVVTMTPSTDRMIRRFAT